MSRLQRPTHDRQIAGVAAGLADFAGMDVNLVRILFVVTTFASAGSVAPIAYLVGWLLMPDARTGRRIIDELTGKAQTTIRGSVDPSVRPMTPPSPQTPQQSVWEQPYQGRLHNPDDLR